MSSKQSTKTSKSSDDFFRLNPLVAGIRVVIAGGLFVGSGMVQVIADPLPVPVIPGTTITDGSAAQGHATMAINGTQETITQTTNQAVIDWKSFDIAKGYGVNFVQPSPTAAVLNNIHDANATQILGSLTANGQVYLVNNNGFIFGKDSTVDANTLVASALNISDANFNGGIIRTFDNNPNTPTPALSGGATTNAEIKVEAGASIHVGPKGTVILAAPTVSNSGSISADQNGQILLVASQDKVYLQPASITSPFAGLLVEVGTGGKVNNNAGANIAVRAGNITLAGFAVNQSGRLSATTSVDVNGSIRLLAREKAIVDLSSGALTASQTVRNPGTPSEQAGTVTLDSGSLTTILADAKGGSAIDEQDQKQSYLEVSADKINMKSGSAIVANSGLVNLTASNTVDLLDAPFSGTKGRIDLEQGSRIDVSGTTNNTVAMTRNVAAVSVQSFNLRNAPYQKGGVLQGQTVQVDVRNLPTIVDASSAPAVIERGISERLSTGGMINLVSGGDVIVNTGAVTNIAGGSVAYQGGVLNTTQLVNAATGQVVDISKADPNQKYAAIYGSYTQNYAKWGVAESWNIMTPLNSGHYEAGYTQGFAAGSLNIQSPVTAWAGTLIAGTVSDLYQRSAPASGGSFTLNQGDNGGTTNLTGSFLSNQNLVFQNTPLASLAVGINDTLVAGAPITLTPDLVNRSGISHLIFKTGGAVTIEKDVNLSLPMLSHLAIDASAFTVLGSIYTPGGTIGLNAVSGQINLGNPSQLNVSGRWVNDFQDGITQPLAINAGKVTLGKISTDGSTTTTQITLSQGAVIKADGGAQLNLAGNNVTAGKAGSINLNASSILFSGPTEEKDALSAIGLSKGGSLSVTTNKINIGGYDATALNLGVNHGNLDLATNAGFNSISLSTIPTFGSDITVSANTNWSFMAKNNVLDFNFRDQFSASSLADFSQLTSLPENLRAPVSLSLTSNSGVSLQTNSQIHLDKGSTFSITDSNAGYISGTGIYIDGLIEAQGGAINLNLGAGLGGNYDSSLGIWLDSKAHLNVQGTTLLNPVDALGRQMGSVLNGGNVNIKADRGYVIFAQGSSVNVNGSHAILNVPVLNTLQNNQQVIGSNAGNIKISAAEGIILDGSISAQKGLATNSGGSLSLTLDRQFAYYNAPPPNAQHIDVQQLDTSVLPNTLAFKAAIPDVLNGQAVVSADKIKSAGIDNITLTVPYQSDQNKAGDIRLLGNVNLNTTSSIILDAQKISWANNNSASNAATLNTGYLALGSSTLDNTDPNDVSLLGMGTLTANAHNIELLGSSVLTGFSAVSLNSLHDMRAVGVNIDPTTKTYIGSLTTAGYLNLQASQLYPSTLTQFSFNLTDPKSQLTISGHNTDATPLSAAGSLSFNAPIINQYGVIKAPLGNIAFNANNSLFFNAGSYTSVSAEGLTIPFGTVLNNVWLYPFAGGNNVVFNAAPGNNGLGIKQLSFTAPNIQFKAGSVVNVSGGGDLTTATFQPGPGGDNDYLKINNGGFAIMPSLGVSSLAPYDPNLSASFANDPRAEVYLSGTANLAAGFYTMLPSYYALLPGAFLVTPQSNTLVQAITTYTAAGLPVVPGYQTLAGTNIQPSLNSGYLIESSAVVQIHSQYDIQTANAFYATQSAANHVSLPLLPEDSGQISINATSQLQLEGQFKVAAPNGRGAKMDISAQNIDVVKVIDPSNKAAGLQLLAEDLNNLQVDSLLLGGTRIFDNVTSNTNLVVSADAVTFQKDVNIQALDLMATAKQRVNVLSGATINVAGQVNTGASAIVLKGDSAFLRVSADKQVQLNRLLDPAAVNLPGTNGDLLIDTGATLRSSQSMLLAGSHSTSLNGTINMSGGSISMEANSINLGNVAELPANALNLTNQNLTNLKGNDVTLTSLGGINFYGDVGQINADNILAPIQFNHLVLDASSLSGYGSNATAMIKANTIDLQNTSGNVSTQAGTGTGTLDLSSTQFNVNKGTIALDGFTTANINVDKQLSATGNSVLNLATNLNLTAGLINTTGGHSLLLDATSSLGHNVNIIGNARDTMPVGNELGGNITVSANNITLTDANVLMPSGALTLKALNGSVSVNGNSNINLAGQAVNFADLVSYTPGGTFSAIANNGAVSLGSATVLNINTGSTKAAGGSLVLDAPQGNVSLAGSLKATGASAKLDVSSFSSTQGFDSLMTKLMAAGVNQTLYVRSRLSDIVQTAGNIIAAKAITLVADAGNIDINGQLNTNSQTQAGNINLYAAKNITLQHGSLLTATGITGGDVLLSALGTSTEPGGTIGLLSGSNIVVTGSSGVGGGVTLNSMRNNESSSGINIAPIKGTVTGENQFNAIGFQKYDASLINSNPINISDATASLSNTIPLDITNYLTSVSPITSADTDNLVSIITTDISNYLADASSITSNDIASLSNIITKNVSNYMITNVSSITSHDMAKLSSTIAKDMNALRASYSNDIAGLSSTINNDISTYMANVTAIERTLGAGITLRPGVEIDNAGAMTLATAWDFSTLSNATTPIVGNLVVRATDALNINASLTDGYLNGGSTLMNTDSWSFQLVSGADLSSADTMATNELSAAEKLTNPTFSDLTIGSEASLHTGTGDIKLASGGNFVLADQAATVYTGGHAILTNPQGTLDNQHTGTGSLAGLPLINILNGGDYPIAGGEVLIQALGDITGAVSNQFIRSTIYGPSWLGVQGHPLNPSPNYNLLTTWSVNASLFQQNIGSFGGGQVNISSLGNINNLSVMMPTTGKQLGTDYANSVLDVQGGGQMTVAAGGNISGGAYFLGQGVATISAGGLINGSQSTDGNAFVSGPQLVMSGNQSNPLIGNTRLTLNANQGIQITGVSDAMVLQSLNNGSQFFSYADQSKLTLNALGGDVHLNSNTNVIATILGIDENISSVEKWLAHVYPASLDAAAFNGSVILDSDIILYPSAVANLNVLAKQGIASNINSITDSNEDLQQVQGFYSMSMSDANTVLLANAFNTIGSILDPTYSMFDTDIINSYGPQPSYMHANSPVHLSDKTSARLVTQVGDIFSVAINMPKQTIIQAGNDLVNSPIVIQQNKAADASIISAARDIKFVTDLDSNGYPTSANNNYQIQVAGPGNVLVKSGRNIDLGASIGLTTIGNILNAALGTTGANLDILVGLKGGTPDYVAFITKYLTTNPLYIKEYAQLTALITPFMQQENSNATLTDAQALAAFAALTPIQTLALQPQINAIITPVFFNELQIAGTASATDKTKGNAGGFEAIETLFPNNQWQGDLTIPFSKIQTVSGGDINLFVPGGQVNGGLAIAPTGVKTPDQLGIVAQTQGSINAYVKNDFTVNTSRVFTLGGGNIEIWSSEGNIDAGKGAKSALAVTVNPPYFDKITNQLVIPAPTITSGSGIRAASAPGQLAGNVSLFAPKGIVNAGEAGIGGNNVTISATAVMGGNNIQIGGTSTGVPQASSGSMAAGLTGASNLTANVSQVGQALAGVDDKESQNNKNNTLSMLSVEVIGFGD